MIPPPEWPHSAGRAVVRTLICCMWCSTVVGCARSPPCLRRGWLQKFRLWSSETPASGGRQCVRRRTAKSRPPRTRSCSRFSFAVSAAEHSVPDTRWPVVTFQSPATEQQPTPRPIPRHCRLPSLCPNPEFLSIGSELRCAPSAGTLGLHIIATLLSQVSAPLSLPLPPIAEAAIRRGEELVECDPGRRAGLLPPLAGLFSVALSGR